jgi:hypothetical protein
MRLNVIKLMNIYEIMDTLNKHHDQIKSSLIQSPRPNLHFGLNIFNRLADTDNKLWNGVQNFQKISPIKFGEAVLPLQE